MIAHGRLGILSLLLAGPAVADDRPSHCTPDEVAVFSCALGVKIVSLCASRNLSATAGTLTYRFGPPGRPERVHPAAPVPARDAFVGGTIDARGGDFVRFTDGDRTTTLFSAFVRDGVQVTGEVEGVEVRGEGAVVFEARCREPALGETGWAPVYRAGLPSESFE